MWNELVTLYIDDSSLRLLVCQGQLIKKWAQSKLEPGLIKGSVILQEEEVVNRIKQLLQSQKVGTKKVIVGFSGLHSLTRPATLPQLPKAMLSEAVIREARRVLPVPLDQLYLFWHTIPGPKGKIRIYMDATPKKTIDSLVKVVRGAGLELTRMAIKPLALTKLIPVNSAILVDLQPDEFDIVIMVNGVSQPIRTITLPNEAISLEQKLNMIYNDLDRTITFYNTNNPEHPLESNLPIYVSGELCTQPELQNILSEKIDHPVIVLSPTLKGPEQIDLPTYSINLAMALKVASPGREPTFPLADMNILPVNYQPKPISLAKIIGIPGAIALISLVIPMIIMMQNMSNQIDATQKQLDVITLTSNKQIALRTNLSKEVAALQSNKNSLRSSSDHFQLVLDYLETRHEWVRGDLILLLGRLGPNITLNSISLSEGNLSLNGYAPTQQDVYFFAQAILNYARNLDSSQRFSETTISSMQFSRPGVNETSNPDQTGDQDETDIQSSNQEIPVPEGRISFSLTFERKGK